MVLTVTRTTRRTAMATLFLFAGQLSVPAWAQAPSMPATGAPATGAPSAPTAPAPRPAAPAPGVSKAPASPAARPAGGPAPAAPRDRGDGSWPREAKEGNRTFIVYQPQIEEWDGTRLHARAAVAVESAASPQQHFGVVWFSARAEVDKASRLVELADFRIDKVTFPSEPGQAADFQKVLEQRLPRDASRISLDRVQAALAITEAQKGAATPQAVKNDPPRIILSTTPALLVLVDGKPVLRPVDGSSLQRVVNSWALILVDSKGGKHYLRAMGRWFEASTVEGPWAPARQTPAGLDAAMQTVAKGQRVNLLDDPGPEIKDATARGVLPTIHVSTVPAELIQTRGRPDYQPIEGTDLLHVDNTSANIVLDPSDQRHYVLLSGRWFRSASLADGPWEFVPHDKLPPAFARIPVTHPRGGVLASISGTPQSKEALIDNSIPQTAAVNRSTTTFQAAYEGAPRFKPIEGTSLQHAENSVTPVIQVDSKTYYALKDGVWFVANGPMGPWAVATTVPAAIYTIPASSPLHYVTYVHVYASTPQTVNVGYTPGYYGTVVAPSSVVVYGTGYVYPPVYVGAYWYPPPPTYGYGVGFAWGTATGFAFGAMTAAAWGGAWGCCGWDDVDIDRTVNINRNDAYNRWNQSQVRSNLESRAQSLTPAQREQARQRAQSRAQGGVGRTNDVYAGRDGTTYRRGAEGWEQNAGQGWNRADFSQGRESAGDLNRQQRARSEGAARETSYQRSGGGSGVSAGGSRPSSGGVRAGGGAGGGMRGGGGARGGGGRRR
jgi:hypothetical protein